MFLVSDRKYSSLRCNASSERLIEGKKGAIQAIPTTISVNIASATNSADRSGGYASSPESNRNIVMQRRAPIKKMATAIKTHAVRLPVIRISLKAKNAAANCSKIEVARTTVTYKFSPLRRGTEISLTHSDQLE